ncbi:MAG TPA: response regulator transcription factor, partial [Anaerolineae bacterium]|nr:response regulator transcription factor [Anaerolineae bacterium]
MKKNKILIVEDDLDTSDMLRVYFEAQGYEVLTAAWGGDALEICQKTLPDLIIQDIRLPDIDGYEICRRLRDNLRTSQIPFIFLTEKRERDDKIAGLKLGAVDYITKPFDVQELRLRVRN